MSHQHMHFGKTSVAIFNAYDKDTEEYVNKLSKMVSDEKVYQKLSSDPTPKYKMKLIALLTKLQISEK